MPKTLFLLLMITLATTVGKIPKFYLISWYGNFAKGRVRWNYGILGSAIHTQYEPLPIRIKMVDVDPIRAYFIVRPVPMIIKRYCTSLRYWCLGLAPHLRALILAYNSLTIKEYILTQERKKLLLTSTCHRATSWTVRN